MNFTVFKNAVATQFNKMQKYPLFRVKVDKDQIWDTYLKSYPEGTDPLFRKRSEHDCSCCRHFARAVGDVVAIIDGKVVSIWDIKVPQEPTYQIVADALSKMVKAAKIGDVFLHYERTAGTDKTFEQLTDNVKTWNHFFVNIDPQFVMKNSDIASTIAEPRAVHDVLLRSLNEITNESIDTVNELIAQQSLYRGDEHKFAIAGFSKLKKQFDKLVTLDDKDLFVWGNIVGLPGSISKMRNTVIGTLLIDISEGKDLENAVGSFEAKVAPMNYKRPTSLITKGMIDKAKIKLEELGLTSALDRRYATINDITINNILFADKSSRKVINGDIFDEMSSQVGVKAKSLSKVEEVSIERFISEILPKADSIEVMFENKHSSNLVSLIAPSDPTSGNLFKWDNNFSWSYSGEVTDSIKERVKKAGGNIVGDLCCRLAWFNFDDLDLHMKEPGGYEISFSNRAHTSPNGGKLDVDMNAGHGQTREAVENIFYTSKKTMKEGVYSLEVVNFSKRETIDVGFEVEFDFMGTVHRFAYDKAVNNRETIVVAQFKYSHAGGIEMIKALPSSQVVRSVWGVPTQTFHPVKVMMMSPNFWDETAVGNKHYFFMIDKCVNDSSARGFFNEFLKEELNVHRKVFEVVGSKMKVVDSLEQLSGLGFSSTQENTLICKVKGSFTRTIKIVF